MTLADKTATTTMLHFGPWYRKSPYFEATLRHGCKAFDIYVAGICAVPFPQRPWTFHLASAALHERS